MASRRLFQPRDFWQIEGEVLAALTDSLGLTRDIGHDDPAHVVVVYTGEKLALHVSLNVRDQMLAARLVRPNGNDLEGRSLFGLGRAAGLMNPPERPAGVVLSRAYARELLEWVANAAVATWASWNAAPGALFPKAAAAPETDPLVEASRAATEALGASDMARVVALLAPFEDRLSRTDAAWLRYARNQIGSVGSSSHKAALRKLALGVGGWLLGGLAFYVLRDSGYEPKGRLAWGVLIALATPGSVALVGLLELATGRSFASLSQGWEELGGWQRGVIGLATCAAAFVVMIGSVALVFGDWGA